MTDASGSCTDYYVGCIPDHGHFSLLEAASQKYEGYEERVYGLVDV